MLHDRRRELRSQTGNRVRSALGVLEREWFGGQFASYGTWGERAMVLLLLSAYAAQERGLPLTKTQAMACMRATNGRTSNRYIARAVRLGLLRERQSPDHGRIVHVIPTPKLERLLEEEMAHLA